MRHLRRDGSGQELLSDRTDKDKEMNQQDIDRNYYEPLIFRWINGRNGARDRLILSMYLFDGITYEQMLDRLEESGYEITKDRLKQVIRKRKEQLFRHCE